MPIELYAEADAATLAYPIIRTLTLSTSYANPTYTPTLPVPIDLYAEADAATLVRVSKRVDKEPIWLSSLATWLRSLVDMEIEVNLP